MSDLIDWIQSYWYELASLTAQIAIAAALWWYGRKALRMLAGAERTTGSIARASAFVGAGPEPQASGFGGVGRMLSETPAATAHPNEATTRRVTKRDDPWHAVIKWLRMPMRQPRAKRVAAANKPGAAVFVPRDPEPVMAGHGGVGRMLSPLPERPEAPVQQNEFVSYRLVKRSGPWQAIVNWLRAPINGRATNAWQRVTIKH
jgi:hypothetical protein